MAASSTGDGGTGREVAHGMNNTAPVAMTNAATTAAQNAVRLARGEPAAHSQADARTSNADETPASGDGNTRDDLQQIDGIGPVVAAKLEALGIRRIADIALWTQEDVARIDQILAIDGRIAREDWIGQARTLVANQAIDSDGR